MCRLLEGVLAYLLYMKYDAVSSSTVAAMVSLGWNGGCVLLAYALDRNNRKAFLISAAAQADKHSSKVNMSK